MLQQKDFFVQPEKAEKVCVLGLWHLGLVAAAVLADIGYRVTGYDPDKKLLTDLESGKLPLYEPGLEELFKKHRGSSRLSLARTYQEAVSDAKTVLITYDTPVDDQDQVDLTVLHSTLESILPHLVPGTLLMVNSQVPVGTCEKWQELIDKKRADAGIDLVCSPENIRLGQAIELFVRPDMMVIGSNSEEARQKAARFYAPFKSEKFYVSWRTAEMAKHALNTFFATSISFANELGNLCDEVGADGIEIAKILKKDSRIGKKAQVRPGLGFAGATLARDLRGLQKIGKEFKVPTLLIDSVLEVNRRQIERLVSLLETHFDHNLSKRKIAVLGLTYKPGTSTLRRSASLELISLLKKKGASISAHDPKADLKEINGQVPFDHCTDPYRACDRAEAIVLMTEWPDYRELNYSDIKSRMSTKKQPLILDAKSYLDAVKIKEKGFLYFELGRGQTGAKS